jgi:RNA-directed DNA polymerase
VIERCQAILTAHLRGMGLAWQPRNPRLTQTLHVEAGEAGVDSLGFNMRQDPTQAQRGYKPSSKPSREALARHQRQSGAVVRRPRMAPQARLIAALHPVIGGWSHYSSAVCSQETFAQRDAQLRHQRRSWSRLRHPSKTLPWGDQQYGRGEAGQWHFKPRAYGRRLCCHTETPMQRHVNAPGRRSPYDGDAVYWGRRRAHHPGVSRRVARRLTRQAGRWAQCGYSFNAGDVLEVDHRIPRTPGGRDASTNWPLRHR